MLLDVSLQHLNAYGILPLHVIFNKVLVLSLMSLIVNTLYVYAHMHVCACTYIKSIFDKECKGTFSCVWCSGQPREQLLTMEDRLQIFRVTFGHFENISNPILNLENEQN